MAPSGFDPAVVAKYGIAGARRRAFRQGLGITDIRKATPAQQDILSGKTPGTGLGALQLLPSHRRMLAKRAATRRSGRGGAPATGGTKPAGAGGPAGGRPY